MLAEVETRIAAVYGTPRLGNKEDPLDELIFIILSRKTRESAYEKGYAALAEIFGSWDAVLAAGEDRVEEVLRTGGLSKKKSRSVINALKMIDQRFGTCTLDPLGSWTDGKCLRFLLSLPEVGPKSALCVMMYSLDRDVFPVDTHVGRCLSRLDPFRENGTSLVGLNRRKLQAVLPGLVPSDLRYSLHVNLIAHGRAVCRSVRPACSECLTPRPMPAWSGSCHSSEGATLS